MTAYVGIDLHSSNSCIGIINQDREKLFGKRFLNNSNEILNALAPFQKDIVGIVIESTYNWYWLVDTLEENGYKVHLANPAAMVQYEGVKHTDDAWDSFWLADMLRLNLLKEGYIYPRETRGLRDLLRRRLLFVRQRTAQILSLQSTITRHLGIKFTGRQIKKLKPEDVHDLFNCYEVALIAKNNITAITYLSKIIKSIEKEVLSKVKLKQEFQKLITIPGIGEILGVTIMLEVGDINRFKKPGNYSSYCRAVSSQRISNGKKKGENNRKNGNKYLSWAYTEAANFAIKFLPQAQKFYHKKKAQKNNIVAIKALSNKIVRASYYIMRDKVDFNPDILFGN